MNGRQVLSGLGWSTVAVVVNAACQFVFMGLLARLLDPGAFGLMAMGALSLRFASYFSQLGFAQAIVQRPLLEPRDTTAALAMALGIGLVLYLLMVAAAPLFAAGFKTRELSSLIDVLGLSLVLGTLGSLPIALLRRHARFKRITGIEVASFVLGYGGVGIGCAAGGLGVWSLVLATLCQQLLVVGLGFVSVRYPLRWPIERAAVRGLWAYGSRHSAIGFLEFLFANVEALLIGRTLGKVELGLFNRAITLTNLPVEFGVGAVNKVLFPALAGMQKDRARLVDGFLMLLLGIGLLSTGMACGIAAAAPDVVALLLGARWQAIAPIVVLVALAVAPMFMYVACGVTLDALAALTAKLRLQAAVLGVKLGLVVIATHEGLPGIAVAVVLAEWLRLGLGLRLVARLLGIDPRRLWRMVGLLAAMGLLVAAAVRSVAVLAHEGVPLVGRVALEALAAAATTGAVCGLMLVRFPQYAPLQRFDALRHWHGRALSALRAGAVPR